MFWVKRGRQSGDTTYKSQSGSQHTHITTLSGILFSYDTFITTIHIGWKGLLFSFLGFKCVCMDQIGEWKIFFFTLKTPQSTVNDMITLIYFVTRSLTFERIRWCFERNNRWAKFVTQSICWNDWKNLEYYKRC